MIGDLFINGKDAFTLWGVNMDSKFLDALGLPPALKEPIENESRLEHGKRTILSTKVASRKVTLTFTMSGSSESDFKTKKAAFLNEIMGKFTLKVPVNGNEVHKFDYKDCQSYAQNISRTFCKIAVRVEESNPMDRD